ncbi:winged helix-turn-helix domain-containing protein [Natronosalvus vescus]|uniref:winged helix-turn-helix domain-containing protein n=1 Tax=Natronosalvus vescus TaxID=2953881 RepID=UPI0020914F41|nr:helix-turn-helix domain-containing protein [Natronosalvus vescus]
MDPASAFAILADETRLAILRAVAEAEREAQSLTGTPTLSFSELYDRVDVSNSSRFAYHLEQLTGTYLRKTDDGYAFTYAGERVVRTIISNSYSEPATFDPVAVAGRCPTCRERHLEARAEAVQLRIRCTGCGQGVGSHPLTPALVVDRDPQEIVDTVDRNMRAMAVRMQAGICDECGGALEQAVHETEIVENDPYLVVCRCRQCWMRFTMPLSMQVLVHPATTSFYWERGIDVRTRSFRWLLDALAEDRWCVDPIDEQNAAGDGTYRVTIREQGDELRVVLESDLTVVQATRVVSDRGRRN